MQTNVLNEQIAVLNGQVDQLAECQKRKDICYDQIKELDSKFEEIEEKSTERSTLMMFIVGKLFSFSLISSILGMINLFLSFLGVIIIFEKIMEIRNPPLSKASPAIVSLFFAVAGLLRFFNWFLWIQLFEFCLPIFVFSIVMIFE